MSNNNQEALTTQDGDMISGGNNPGIQINSLEDLKTLANVFVESGSFDDIKGVAQAMVKIMAGMELGIPHMTAMREIYVMEGNTQLSGPLLAALIKRSPKYDYRVVGVNNRGAKISFFEHGEHVGDATFTLGDAQDANLLHKPNWQKYRKDMFIWRAMSRGQRVYCPDVGFGSLYLHGEIPNNPSPNDDSWKGNAPKPADQTEDEPTNEDNDVDDSQDVDFEVESTSNNNGDDLVPPKGEESNNQGQQSEPDWESEIKGIKHNINEWERSIGLNEKFREKLRDINSDVETWPSEHRKVVLDLLDKYHKKINKEQEDDKVSDAEYQKVFDKISGILEKHDGDDIVDAIEYYEPQTEDWRQEWKDKVDALFEKHMKRYEDNQEDDSDEEVSSSMANLSSMERDDSNQDLDWQTRMTKCENLLRDKLEDSGDGLQPIKGLIDKLGDAISKADVTDAQMGEYQREVLPYRTIVRLRAARNGDDVNEDVFNESLEDFIDELNTWPNGLEEKAEATHDMVLDEAKSIAKEIDGFSLHLEDDDDEIDVEPETEMILPNLDLESLPEDEQLTRQSKLIEAGYKKTKVVQDAIDRGVLQDVDGIGIKTVSRIKAELENLMRETEVVSKDENPFG